MPLLLELRQLGEDHDVAEVDVGRRRVDSQLDAERIARGELLLQPSLRQDLLGPAPEDVEVSHA